MIWPEAVAPFAVGLVNLKVGDARLRRRLRAPLCGARQGRRRRALRRPRRAAGREIRDAWTSSALPHQVIVGPKSLAEGKVEVKTRRGGERELVSVEAAIARLGTDEAVDCAQRDLLPQRERARSHDAAGARREAASLRAVACSAAATRPFSPFEWMVAFRYLRARNGAEARSRSSPAFPSSASCSASRR